MAAPTRPEPRDPATGMAPMTLEQFLAWEETQDRRYEFVDGFVRLMGGNTIRHNTVVGNVLAALRPRARTAGCAAHATALQVRVPGGRVYYPDVAVRSGPFAYADRHVRTPCLIVEVTAPSTRAIDRREKRDAYRAIPSLRAYVIIEQAVRRMDCHVRRDDGTWAELEVSDVTGVREFATPCVDAVLTLDEVYADTDILPPPADLFDLDTPRPTRAEPSA